MKKASDLTPLQRTGVVDFLIGWAAGCPKTAHALAEAERHALTCYPATPDQMRELARTICRVDELREPCHEPTSPEAEEWDCATASNEDFLNRERHRA